MRRGGRLMVTRREEEFHLPICYTLSTAFRMRCQSRSVAASFRVAPRAFRLPRMPSLAAHFGLSLSPRLALDLALNSVN
jgi:hypothetical protein